MTASQSARRARRAGDLASAALFYEQALQSPDIPRDEQLPMMNALADLLRRTDRLAEALALARELVAERREYGSESLLANDLMFLSQVFEASGHLEEARTAAAEALPIYERVMGANHREVELIRSNVKRLDGQLS
jgi:hypothetical protein